MLRFRVMITSLALAVPVTAANAVDYGAPFDVRCTSDKKVEGLPQWFQLSARTNDWGWLSVTRIAGDALIGVQPCDLYTPCQADLDTTQLRASLFHWIGRKFAEGSRFDDLIMRVDRTSATAWVAHVITERRHGKDVTRFRAMNKGYTCSRVTPI